MGMGRIPAVKELENARLLKAYASWVYCTGCEKTVAYLCYVTYDAVDFQYDCACGSHGRVRIEFEGEAGVPSNDALADIKNRLCCPHDQSPLITVVEKNLTAFNLSIKCHECHGEYRKTSY